MSNSMQSFAIILDALRNRLEGRDAKIDWDDICDYLNNYLAIEFENYLKIKHLFITDPIVVGRTATYIKNEGEKGVSLLKSRKIWDFTDFEEVAVIPYKTAVRQKIPKDVIERRDEETFKTYLQRALKGLAYLVDKDCFKVLQEFTSPDGTKIAMGGEDRWIYVNFNKLFVYFALKRPIMCDFDEDKNAKTYDIVISLKYTPVVIENRQEPQPEA